MTKLQELAKVQRNKWFFTSRLIAKPDAEELRVKVEGLQKEEDRIKKELGR